MNTEEDVKIQFLLPMLERLGYKRDHCEFEKAITIHEGLKQKQIFADVIVYSSAKKETPLLLCETKSPREILNKAAREQAISYSRLLPRIAPLTVLTNGSQVQVFQTLSKTRLTEIPKRQDLVKDLMGFAIPAEVQESLRREARHQLFIIDDVETFKNVLQACHNTIRNNDGLDPTAAFDEMSKILFCKLFEEKRNGNNRFRLSVFDEYMADNVNVIRHILDETKKDPKFAGLFTEDATINLQDRTIRRIVELFENYDLSLTAFDVKGEAFEYFLGDTFTGGLGEYFTPRNIVEFMVSATDPKIGERVVDPFCGTGGFLLFAFDVVSEKIRLQDFSDEEKERWRLELSNRSLYGTDWKERTSQACKMNMTVHGDGSAGIIKHDGFVDVGDITEASFDLCLTNPPFGADETNPKVLERFELGAGRASQDRVVLAIERCIRLVKPGRLIAIVVIDGILNNISMKYIRDYIRREAVIRGVVSLNKETFEAYGAQAKTSILLLQRRPTGAEVAQGPVFMAVAGNTGYAPNGAPIPGNQLPEILLDYRAFLSGQPVGHFRDAWVTDLADRLDAEYYWKRETKQSGADELRSASGSTRQVLSDALEALDTIEVRIDAIPSELANTPTRLGDILEETSRPEKTVRDREYRLLGVRSKGDGVFERETKRGEKIKAKRLYTVRSGELIYNRLFAFRGSFAIVPPELADGYVSGEFPSFKLRDDVPLANDSASRAALARFIVHTLLSQRYLAAIDSKSTGSTKQSRNRFNQRELLDLKIHLPKSKDDLMDLIGLLDASVALHDAQGRAQELVKAIRQDIAFFVPKPG